MSIYIPYYLRTEMSACMDWIAWLILGLATSRREPTVRDCDRLDLYLKHRSGTALLSVPETQNTHSNNLSPGRPLSSKCHAFLGVTGGSQRSFT